MISVNVIQAGTPQAFDALLYPESSPDTLQYIHNQFQNISHTLMESGRQFVEKSRTLVDQFYDSSVARAARAAVRMAKNLMTPNTVRRFETLDDIQSAGPLMQRYVMTDPGLRQKFHQQLCSGYAGSYMDLDPGMYGEQQYDWRRVNQGMLRFEGEGKEEEWVCRTYLEDLREGDRELSFDERIDILSTIDYARLFMERGQDPTCPFGSRIG